MYAKELTEKKNDLISKAEEVLNKAKMETRELTEDEAAMLEEIYNNVGQIVKSLKLDDDFRELEEEKNEEETTEEEETVEETRSIEMQERAAFEAYIRGEINERS